MEDYFLGHSFWQESLKATEGRRSLYETRKNSENGVYSIDWNTNLDVNDVIQPRKK